MKRNKELNSGFNNENPNRDKRLSGDPDAEHNEQNLSFNEEDGSFELDVESDDPDYDHPDPYHTSVKNGGDFDSSYDEANPTANDEYEEEEDPELDESMHIGRSEVVKISAADELLAKTPEDDQDDLDEEGYPINKPDSK
ncbi:MAG: hypothetical protein ACOH2A_03035 [Sphingobacteriaceae bacterium]